VTITLKMQVRVFNFHNCSMIRYLTENGQGIRTQNQYDRSIQIQVFLIILPSAASHALFAMSLDSLYQEPGGALSANDSYSAGVSGIRIEHAKMYIIVHFVVLLYCRESGKL
jgi:hypothetical protein